MGLEQELALTRPWWVWKAPAVRKALAVVHLTHWLPVVRRALEENRRCGRSPTAWKELGDPLFLDRDPRNLARWQSGMYGLTYQDLLGLATSLKLSVSDLLPTTRVWIARTTEYLCQHTVTAEAADAYAVFRLSQPAAAVNPDLDQAALQAVAAALPGAVRRLAEAREVVLKTAAALGNVLAGLEEGHGCV